MSLIERQKNHMIGLIDGSDNFGVVGHSNRQRRTSVKGTAKRDDLFSSGGKRGEFEGVFIGLRAGVAQKKLIVRLFGHLPQFPQ